MKISIEIKFSEVNTNTEAFLKNALERLALKMGAKAFEHHATNTQAPEQMELPLEEKSAISVADIKASDPYASDYNRSAQSKHDDANTKAEPVKPKRTRKAKDAADAERLGSPTIEGLLSPAEAVPPTKTTPIQGRAVLTTASTGLPLGTCTEETDFRPVMPVLDTPVTHKNIIDCFKAVVKKYPNETIFAAMKKAVGVTSVQAVDPEKYAVLAAALYELTLIEKTIQAKE